MRPVKHVLDEDICLEKHTPNLSFMTVVKDYSNIYADKSVP